MPVAARCHPAWLPHEEHTMSRNPLLMAAVLLLSLATMAGAGTIVDTGDHPSPSFGTPAVAGWQVLGFAQGTGVAWSFVPPSDNTALGFELPLWRLPQSSGNTVTVAIHANDGVMPGAVLRTLNVSNVPTCYGDLDNTPSCFGGWSLPLTSANFASNLPLSGGTTYWLVVTTPPGTSVYWSMNGKGSCAGGRVGGGAWMVPPDTGIWQAFPEVNLIPDCSASFKVTYP